MSFRFMIAVVLLIAPIASIAHPGGGVVALDANTVLFADSMYNSVWKLEKGKTPQALITKFHAHWVTLGLNGQLYAEAFQEMGGALMQIDMSGSKHIRIAQESDVNAPVFAVGKRGELIFQKGDQIIERSRDGTTRPFRGSGKVAQGEALLKQVIAITWAADGTLYLSDGGNLRLIGADGIVRFAARIDGKLLEPQIWNSTNAPRIWSLAIDDRKRIYAALPDLGKVVRIDTDGTQHVVDKSPGGWRVTGVAAFGDSIFLLESSDMTNDGQRVRVMRGTVKAELFGQVEAVE